MYSTIVWAVRSRYLRRLVVDPLPGLPHFVSTAAAFVPHACPRSWWRLPVPPTSPRLFLSFPVGVGASAPVETDRCKAVQEEEGEKDQRRSTVDGDVERGRPDVVLP